MSEAMKPYFELAGVRIYHGDCRDILPSLDEDSVDLVVTDPPYGIDWQSGRRKVRFAKIAEDESTAAGIIGIALSLPALRRGRHIYAFGRYDLSQVKVAGPAELIWDKEMFNGGDLTIPWGSQHEPIEFYINNKDSKLGKTSDGALSARLRRGSVLRCKRLNATAIKRHPTEKPVELLRYLIESSSTFDEVVLDPFLGSGSTLVAALLEGRRGIGIELEERYCEVAANRLRDGSLHSVIARWRERAAGPVPTDRAIGIDECADDLLALCERIES